MKQSELFCKTKKQAPKDAETISHKYLVRGDFIEQSFSGVYRFLPLGWRVHKKIEEIIRQEMINLGAQEISLPALQNKSLWLETNRWNTIDPPLFKLKDRHDKETALGPTHEEEIADLIRTRVKSYQDLPQYLFQIQNKFRNEMRATGGLLRTREFIMKDLYSFHSEEEDLDNFYKKVQKSYLRIFNKCGLNKVVIVRALGGTIGGKKTDEFMIISPAGEDKIVVCQKCSFAANVEAIENRENCPNCKGKLESFSSIEIGHTFNLGTKYSEIMGAKFVGRDGKLKSIIMGCYGIGLGRLIATIVEKNNDEKGVIWPKDIAPFQIHLIKLPARNASPARHADASPAGWHSDAGGENSQKVKKEAEKLYQNLSKQGIEMLYDDRDDKTAGEKFADADLIGIPIRIVVSERTLKQNCVEIKKRNEKKTKLLKIQSTKSVLRQSLRTP